MQFLPFMTELCIIFIWYLNVLARFYDFCYTWKGKLSPEKEMLLKKYLPSFVNRRVIYLWIKIFDWNLKFQIEDMNVFALFISISLAFDLWVGKRSERGLALIDPGKPLPDSSQIFVGVEKVASWSKWGPNCQLWYSLS